MSARTSDFSGWSLFTLLCSAVLVLSAVVLLIVPGIADATLAVALATACTSFALIIAAFVTPSLARWVPDGLALALMRERRVLVLSSAFSTLIQTLAIATYGALEPARAAVVVVAVRQRILSTDTLYATPISLLCAAVVVRLVGGWAQANPRRQPRNARHFPRSWSS